MLILVGGLFSVVDGWFIIVSGKILLLVNGADVVVGQWIIYDHICHDIGNV